MSLHGYVPEWRSLSEELIRVGRERDTARQELEELKREVYPLRERVDYLERKYEPKPQRWWKTIEVDAAGNPVQPEGAR